MRTTRISVNIMRTSGKYESWEKESFTIQCNYDELNDLYLGLRCFMRRDDVSKELKSRIARWFKMLEEIDKALPDEPVFGTDYFVTKCY